MKKTVLFGVAGASGSGKSTYVEFLVRLLTQFRLRVIVLKMDDYYLDLSGLTEAERKKRNFDHPGALDLGLLREHLQALQAGRPIQRPTYSFVTHTVTGYEHIDPDEWDVIIVEGIMLYCDEMICEYIGEASAFVDVNPFICFWRRLTRDRQERGRSTWSVLRQYITTVLPGWWKYVRPYRHRAAIRVHGGGRHVPSHHRALAHIRRLQA